MANGYYSAKAVEQHGMKLRFTGEGKPPASAEVNGLTLVARVDGGQWRIATDVSNPIVMKAHLDSLKSGRWKTFELYSIADDKLALCEEVPGQGREPSRYTAGGQIQF